MNVVQQIRHRHSGAVIFEAAVDAELDVYGRIGAAVTIAVGRGARLDGANLDGARLDGANLDGASLDRASLDGASLVGASLDGASLVGASLVGASGIIDVGTPNGYRFLAVRHASGLMISAGCRWFAFRAAVSHWASRADRAETRAALDYVRAVARIKGWRIGDESDAPSTDEASR